MKNIALVLLLAISLALGALVVQQHNKSLQTQSELARVQTQLTEAQNQLKAVADAPGQIADAKRSSKFLQESLTETARRADEKAKLADQLQQDLAAKTNQVNPMAGIAKMFNDPQMKEMIKTQQKTMMGPMIDQQYDAFFKQANLSADQSAQLKSLLMDKMMAGADIGMSMMDDSIDDAKRAELAKQVKATTDASEEQIKQFLGDAYPAFQSYEKSVPDRMTVSQFSGQLSGDNALTTDQEAQLIQAMSDARTSFKWTSDLNNNNNNNPSGTDFKTMFTQDKIDQFTQEKEQFDQQFLAQAQKILTPAQATQFEQFQSSQRQLQLMGFKMASQMFAPKSQ